MAEKTEENTARRMMVGGAARAFGLVVRMGVGFFMLPFLVGQLGNYWYGVYYATVGLVANFYLMDLGFANATMRETAVGLARADNEAVNRTINTAFRIYLALGGVVLVATLALAAMAPTVLGAGTDATTVRLVLLLIGIDLALTFPIKSLAGIVMGKLRFDLLLILDLTVFLISTAANIWVLTHGFGVVALAVIALATGQLHNVAYVLLAKHLFPALVFSWRRFDRQSGRAMASYSLWAFLIQLANQLRFRVDSLTTGALFGGEAITRYAIGGRLVEYAQTPLVLVSNTAMPALTKLHVAEDSGRMSEVVVFLLRLHLVLAIYATGLIMLLGRPFIVTWMGPEFGPSHQVAVILSIGFMTELFLTPLTNSLFASAKHRMLAIANITDAIANVILSITLGWMYGLVGVALGTTIPLLLVQLFWVAPYACRALKIELLELVGLLWPAALAVAVFAALAFALGPTANSNGYLGVVLAGTVATAIYWPAVFFGCLSRDDRHRLWKALPLPTRR